MRPEEWKPKLMRAKIKIFVFISAILILGRDLQAQIVRTNLSRIILFDRNLNGAHATARQNLRALLSRLQAQHGFQLQMTQDTAAIDSANLDTTQILVFA